MPTPQRKPRLKAIKKKPDLIYIDEQTRNQLRAQNVVIAQQEHILNALRLTFSATIQEKYNVDLAQESWELDIDKGELRRAEQPTEPT